MAKQIIVKYVLFCILVRHPPYAFLFFASAAVGFDLASSDPVFSCLALLPAELSSLAPPPPQTSSFLYLKMAKRTLVN